MSTVPNPGGPELGAQRRAAAAVHADFHAALTDYQVGGPEPDYASWALRLAQHLGSLLGALGGDPASRGAAPAEEMSVRELRGALADVINAAGMRGQVTFVTSRGRRVAAVVSVAVAEGAR